MGGVQGVRVGGGAGEGGVGVSLYVRCTRGRAPVRAHAASTREARPGVGGERGRPGGEAGGGVLGQQPDRGVSDVGTDVAEEGVPQLLPVGRVGEAGSIRSPPVCAGSATMATGARSPSFSGGNM